jgi:glutamate-5-semialdehyde dehydrogenase
MNTTVFAASLATLARQNRAAAQFLAQLDHAQRQRALMAVAAALRQAAPEILAANQADCQQAQTNGLAAALYARLKLDVNKLNAAIEGVESVAQLPDPLGVAQLHRELDDGLVLQRLTCPIGVVAVIFEARPDAVVQISALAIKSGNGIILKGGQEALQSCQALVAAIHQGLAAAGVSPAMVTLLTSREETRELLNLEAEVDLIIPRGSNDFVRFVQSNTHIPVLGHAEGICHLYVDAAANLSQAITIAVDAKTQYPAACNAIETLLVHEQVAAAFLPQVATALRAQGVELRGDAASCALVSDLKPATESDWSTEYSDLILSIKVVNATEAAIEHIQTYGSKHTEAIVTEDAATATLFRNRVNAAGVFHNCSTRFSDGFRYGFGAEVGISTQTLPPRGPVGLEGLVTYKYHLVGAGHVVSSYSGSTAKPFTHRDIDVID